MDVQRHRAILSILGYLLAGLAGWAPALHAQKPASASIRQMEMKRYEGYRFEREEQWDSLFGRAPHPSLSMRSQAQPQAPACPLNRMVFGWSPYWMGTAYESFDYSLLSDVCYFSYEVDPATGNYTDIHNWKTTGLIPMAKANGTRVHLCATLFNSHGLLFANPASRRTLIDSLVALVKLRDGDGVNIDFEGVAGDQRANLAQFMAELAARFHTEIPGSIVSMAVPPVDWSNAFDVASMAAYVDMFFIMGYDYHWTSSSDAGPVAPKNNGSRWSPYDVTRSIRTYLGRGVPSRQLALGVPYYGYDWRAADSTPGAATLGAATAVRFETATQRAAEYGRRWDTHSSTPYYVYRSGSEWHQTWYDDQESLGLKYDLVLSRNLAGIGIWALGYDGASRALWDAIAGRFTICGSSPCSGTVADMGGPTGNYFENDSYTFTIAPPNAASVALSFYSFSIADDTLLIYNGADTSSPLLGAYSGSTSPGTVTGTNGALTLKFRSNTGGTSWGWIANWNCTQLPLGAPSRPDASLPDPDIRILPNPSRGGVTVQYMVARPSRVEISVADILGKILLQRKFNRQPAGLQEAVFSADELSFPAGSYIVRISIDGVATSRKMVLEK